jgi:osmoprotectant transport system substrate-binding protein
MKHDPGFREREGKKMHVSRFKVGVAGLVAAVLTLLVATTTGSAAPAAPVAKAAAPTIILGTKDFTEEFVLGELYKQALEAKGFKVQYKPNIGSTEIIDTALTSGKINMYPEYIGEIVQTVFHQKTLPKTAHGWWTLGKSLEEKRGYTLLNATPFFDVDAIAVRKADATKYGLVTVPDLAKIQGKMTIKLGARPEFKNREEGFKGMQDVYGLTKLQYVSIANGLTYQALDQNKVFAINVFSTDAQLSTGKYVVLKDPKLIFGVQNVAPVVSKKVLAAAGPKFAAAVNAVSAKLTAPAIVAMNGAVVFNKKTPKSVASAFLKANGLG